MALVLRVVVTLGAFPWSVLIFIGHLDIAGWLGFCALRASTWCSRLEFAFAVGALELMALVLVAVGARTRIAVSYILLVRIADSLTLAFAGGDVVGSRGAAFVGAVALLASMLGPCLVLIRVGSGGYSFDAWLRRRRSKPGASSYAATLIPTTPKTRL